MSVLVAGGRDALGRALSGKIPFEQYLEKE